MKNQRANDAHNGTTSIFAKNIVAILCILLLFNRKIRLRKQIWREHFRNFRIAFRVRMQPVTEQFGIGVFAALGQNALYASTNVTFGVLFANRLNARFSSVIFPC